MAHQSFGGGSGPGGVWGAYLWDPSSAFDYQRQAGDLWRSSAVASCLRVLRDNFPEPELCVNRKGGRGKDKKVENHPLVNLFNKPNPGYDRYQLWGIFVLAAVVDGNAYLMKVRSAAGVPVELWWIPPWMMRPVWDMGDPYTWIKNYEYYIDGATYIVDPADVIHYRHGIDPRNDRLGMSPLKAAGARSICSLNEVDGFTASILRNMGVPSCFIAPAADTGTISPQDADYLTKQWADRTGGENRGKPFIAGGPVKVTPVSMTPEQMALHTIPDRLEDTICSLMGVPAMVVGLTAGATHKTYANMKEAHKALYDNTIIPMQAAVAECLEYSLLGDPGMGNPETETIAFSYVNVDVMSEDQEQLARRAGNLWQVGAIRRDAMLEMIGLESEPTDHVYIYELQGMPAPQASAGLSRDVYPTPPAPKGLPHERSTNGQSRFAGAAESRWQVGDPGGSDGDQDAPGHQGSARRLQGGVPGIPGRKDNSGGVLFHDGQGSGGASGSQSDRDGQGQHIAEGDDRRPFEEAKDSPPLVEPVPGDAPDPDEDNTFGLPNGTPLRRNLQRFIPQQMATVLGTIPPQTVALPQSFPSLTDYDDPIARAMTPVISAYWDRAGQATTAALGLDPATWQVTDPHLAEMIDRSTLNFAASTNQTTDQELGSALGQLRTELHAGLVTAGESIPQLRDRVQSVFTRLSNDRADLIARTEASRAVHAASIESARQSGVVTGKKWLLSSNACPRCHAFAEMVPEGGVPLDDEFGNVGSHPDYSSIRFPPGHPRCRCTVTYVLTPEYQSIVDANPPETYQPGPLGPEPRQSPPPEPVAAPAQPAPAGIPVGNALDVQVPGEFGDRIRSTIGVIDSVHGDGNLPTVPIQSAVMQAGRGGQVGINSAGVPRFINVAEGGFYPELAAVHEIGHTIDYGAMRAGGQAWTNNAALAEVRDALHASEAATELRRLATVPSVQATGADLAGTVRAFDLPIDAAHVAYLSRDDELWARSYAQYIATRSGDTTLMEQLEVRRGPGPLSFRYPEHWTDEDFAPIGTAIDNLFSSLGWRH